MFDRDDALEVIERAMDTDPYCPACGAPSAIVDDAGQIYLRCSAASERHGFIARVSAAFLPHLQRELLDLRPDVAA